MRMCGTYIPVYMYTCLCAYMYCMCGVCMHVLCTSICIYVSMHISEYVWLCAYDAGLVYERKCDICLSGSGLFHFT